MKIDGPWQIRRVGDTEWRPVDVPGCWEDAGFAKDDAGPFDYRTSLSIPPGVWRLRFGAVSYACEVYVDDVRVGQHLGMWDSFDVDLTDVAGSTVELRVRVEKPASLTAGPDSANGPGRFPVRSTLAGFLPYVWGHSHGGIWQDVELVAEPSISAWGTADGEVRVDAPAEVIDPDGNVVAVGSGVLQVPDPQLWSPDSPVLYTIRCGATDRRIGLRTLTTDGSQLRLNGAPLYPRMLLSWGWYGDRLDPNPGPDRVRADLETIRGLGFNGVKLCLWFPPRYYFDIADELGMLLWVELPMWLPQPGSGFATQAAREIEALVLTAREHPSVILYSLGCELSDDVDGGVLEGLYRRTKTLTRDALVCDNSGSGEAYGGPQTDFADFYDHHLYCDLQHLPETLDHFAPRWRAEKPWLFGEFCDLDTWRDPRAVADQWWTSADPVVNPQGARWQYDAPEMEGRVRRAGWLERGDELVAISHRQALLHRKVTLETVRARQDTSGYVITGERDTPISTAGLLDDFGRLKVPPDHFAAFNADTVPLLGWDRRRSWTAGGDRPAPYDVWCYRVGAVVRPHILLAHHGIATGRTQLRWTLRADDEEIASGVLDAELTPGSVRKVGVAEFLAPQAKTAVLTVEEPRTGARNSWRFWFVPPFELDLADVVATRWTPELDARVRAGDRVILLADSTSEAPVPLEPMPFWREAIKVIEPHPAWGDFPHDGWVDLQFAGCATDLAFTTRADARPILRRVDARTGAVHDYAAELPWGAGTLLISTLAINGGHGDQPRGIATNTAAAYLLQQWIRFCAS